MSTVDPTTYAIGSLENGDLCSGKPLRQMKGGAQPCYAAPNYCNRLRRHGLEDKLRELLEQEGGTWRDGYYRSQEVVMVERCQAMVAQKRRVEDTSVV